MDKLLTMSNKELTRLEVMQRIQEKRLTQKEAAHMLGLSIRHVKRLYRAFLYRVRVCETKSGAILGETFIIFQLIEMSRLSFFMPVTILVQFGAVCV